MNLPKIVVGGRERKEIRICGMCEHVHNCVLFMYKLLDLMMPEKCQNCKKTNESQLKKFLCWFYSFKYFRGKRLGSSSKDFLGQRHLSTWREVTKSALLSVFIYSHWDSLLQNVLDMTTAQDAICSLLFPIVLYVKRHLSRTQDTNQTALRSAKWINKLTENYGLSK